MGKLDKVKGKGAERKMVKKAMIMAAGVGSRLDPLTQEVPKPLIPIANRPVMDILLEKLIDIGIVDVVANTHYKAEKIIERYKHNDMGINFNHIHEEELSGTAGGVKKCQFFFDKGEDFLVLSADGLSNADLKAGIGSHKKSGAIVTMGIKKIALEEIPNFGVVVTDKKGFVTGFQEKPAIKHAKSDCINTGIYIFNYKIFDYIPANTFYDFAKNVFPDLLSKDIKINTFQVKEYWSDIGTIAQYSQSTQDLFNGLLKINHSEIIATPKGAYIKGNSHIASSAVFYGFNTIGKDCIIGKNVVLKDCIIWDDVEIHDNLILKNCIVASHSEIKVNMVNQTVGPNQIISHGIYD
ncbi:MAG: NDP-sugar synthase [Candidatus Gastranaerophilales bacterium]|nr:NDP-sugar synthase [Candidatus Gastranaerophilales bacterium]